MSARRIRSLVAGAAVAAAGVAGMAVHGRAVSASGPFLSPVTVSGDRVSEPGINVAADGAIYINGPTGLLSNLPGSPSAVYKSTQGGAAGTWTRLPDSLKAPFPGGGDSNVAIDPTNGTLYETDLWLGSSTVSQSKDGGQTWTANPLGGVIVQDRQWLTSTGGGTVYMGVHQIPSGIVVSKSIDGGVTYPISVLAATALDQTGCICPPGNIVSEPGGLTGDKVGITYATSSNGVNFAHSENGGLTWTNTPIVSGAAAPTNSNFPVVADAGNGHLVAVWLENDGATSSTVHVNTSSNFGASWGTPRTLVGDGTSVYPWVDARGSKVSVVLYHNTSQSSPDTTAPGVPWSNEYLESTDGGATFGARVSLDPQPIKLGPICTGGTNCSANRELGDFETVTIDPAGRANVSYIHSHNDGTTEIRFVRQS